jgi:WD40 repeat protein
MQRWFLSYNSQDVDLAQSLEAALRKRDADAHIFFAPKGLRAGGRWLPRLAEEIAAATAFVLVVGQNGVGPWQVMEYDEALDRHVKNPDFPIIFVLLDGQQAPGLPFLRQLHWIVTADLASEQTVAKVLEATTGNLKRLGELWRHTAPYRGLAAMTEADSDFFFGRSVETVEVLKAMHGASGKMPLLIGNSGVGKSSLAQAGILAALKRQSFPEGTRSPEPWPGRLHDSRQWCFLKLSPGASPLAALVEPFLRTWQFDATDPAREKKQRDWIEALFNGDATLSGLLDATERRYEDELQQPKPPAFCLYVDQAEELYVRAEERQRRRFSELLAQGLADPRLRLFMSMRSDFFGALQNDEPLYAVHELINVAPLRLSELEDVVSKPAKLLSARFDTDKLPLDIARRTAEESTKDAGALPLLSYLLDDMWKEMVRRGDGLLRLPAHAVELGGVLADRANAFLRRHPQSEDMLRRIMTLKLATVREDGEPTRRHALRSEFSDAEWRLVSDLADHPNRLLITAATEGGETYAEVAHEAIFRRWDILRGWMEAEREFLAWRNSLDMHRHHWESAPPDSREEALLMGLALARAHTWLDARGDDLPASDRDFIEQSLRREAAQRALRDRLRRRALWASVAAAIFVAIATVLVAAFIAYEQKQRADEQHRMLEESERNRAALRAASLSQSRLLTRLAEDRLAQQDMEAAAAIARQALPYQPGTVPSDCDAACEALWNADMTLLTRALGRDRLRAVLAEHKWSGGTVKAAAFSADGKLVVTASDDRTARIFDAGSGSGFVTLAGHTDTVNDAAFSSDAQLVVTASDDGTVRTWNARSGAAIAVLEPQSGKVQSAIFRPGTREIFVVSEGGITVWDPAKKEPWKLEGYAGVLSADGKWILATAGDENIVLLDVATHVQLAKMHGHGATVLAGDISPDGKWAVTASEDGTATVWNAHTGESVAELTGRKGKILSATFSPDPHAQYVLTTSDDRIARLWNAQSGAELKSIGGIGGRMTARFSRDGAHATIALGDATVVLMDIVSLEIVATFKGHEKAVTAAVLSPDGKRLLTASEDQTARLWDARDGEDMLWNPETLSPADRIAYSEVSSTRDFAVSGPLAAAATNVPRQNAARDACGKLAAGAEDPRKAIAGAKTEAPSVDAITACRSYVSAHPGDAAAMYQLGRGLEKSGAGQEALKVYRDAADKGSAAAFYYLALAYWTGSGVAQDRKRALDWLDRGAKAGDPLCHRWLAELHERGEGVTTSLAEALLHHIEETTLFERRSDEVDAAIARLRRASVARNMTPQDAVNVVHRAK